MVPFSLYNIRPRVKFNARYLSSNRELSINAQEEVTFSSNHTRRIRESVRRFGIVGVLCPEHEKGVSLIVRNRILPRGGGKKGNGKRSPPEL